MGKTKKPARTHPEVVSEARFVPRASVFLRFADGLEGTWSFRQLGLRMSNMKPATLQASASGKTVEVTSKSDDLVQLDSSALRASVDPAYAAAIEKKLNAIARRMGL